MAAKRVIPFLLSLALFVTPRMLASTIYFGGVAISGQEKEYETCNFRTGVCTWQWQTGTVSVTVNGSQVSTHYEEGSTSESIASALCSEMTGGFPAPCTSTSGEGATYFINFQGAENYAVSATVANGCPPDDCVTTFSAVAPAGKADPKYYILSLLYAPPGNKSSNGYTNSTTYGTTTTIGESFSATDSTTFSASEGLFGSGGTESWTFAFTAMVGNSEAVGWSVVGRAGRSSRCCWQQ